MTVLPHLASQTERPNTKPTSKKLVVVNLFYHYFEPLASGNLQEVIDMFDTIMKIKANHSAVLYSLGFSKDFVRNYSPVHALLVKLAFYSGRKEGV